MEQLNPPDRILLGPGPSNVHPKVLAAMSTPLIGYMDQYQFQVMDEIVDLLRNVFKTRNAMTIPIAGTGMAGMEASICNIVERGDEVVVGVNGVFGQRISDVVQRCGGRSVEIKEKWGNAIKDEDVGKALSNSKAKAVAVVQAETSTGVLQPIRGISKIAHDHNALLIVDAVTSLGGCDLEIDDFGIDICYSGSQKCLNAPPGLAPVTFNEKAMEMVRNRKTKVQSFYLDMTLVEKYWMKGNRVYHHTPATSLLFALREALGLVVEEGLENRWERHKKNSEALVRGVEAMGLEMLVSDRECRLPSLNSVICPSNAPEAVIRKSLLEDYHIEIGGGLGELAGKIWRIGLMGLNSNQNNIILFVSALEQALRRNGFPVKTGQGISAVLDLLWKR
jgi:alanine-glyoxylate transaminase/serine-glyoxylate transaminase/serine-pyruvate transaminase